MANTFQTQTLFEKALAFQWEANEGLGDHITWENDLFKPQNQPGASTGLRRPDRIPATSSAMGADFSLPGVTQPANYSSMAEPTVQLTLTTRLEANIQMSIEEMIHSVDKDIVEERHLKPAIVAMKNQLNLTVAQAVSQKAGQVISMGSTYSGSSANAQNFLEALAYAESAMIQRGAASENEEKILVSNMNVHPKIAPAAATLFNYGKGVGESQRTGKPMLELGGFRMFRSPLLDSLAVTSQTGITTSAASGLTSWAETWTVALTGITTAIVAGQKVSFSVSGVGVNWVTPDLLTDTGILATFTVRSATTLSGGAQTLTLSEPLVYSGNFRNTTLSAQLPSGATCSVIGGGTTVRPNYAFVPKAIVGCSPSITIPKGVAFGKEYNTASGFRFAMIEDHWPGTLQNITKLVAFVGVAVPLPEGVAAIIGL